MAGILISLLSRLGLRLGLVDGSKRDSSAPDLGDKAESAILEKVLRLRAWDEGVLHQSLAANNLFPRRLDAQAEKEALGWLVPAKGWDAKLEKGTYAGTCKALTQVMDLVEKRFSSYLDVTGIQPSIPLGQADLQIKRRLYQWSPGPDGGTDYDKYPPHLQLIPPGSADDVDEHNIFNHMRLLDTGFLLASIVPQEIKDFVYCEPSAGSSIAQVETRNRLLRITKKNIYEDPNIGDRKNWFTDEVFAQQSFTGNNPSTITAAGDWAEKFTQAAKAQNNAKMVKAISSTEKTSLYVQDLSYVREACGVAAEADLWVKGDTGEGDRYACAPVTLYRLQPDGKLFPLAICIDFKGSMDKSVVIFNKRLQSSDRGDQSSDWAWRYAKTCAQVGDWLRHEVQIHLNDCHLIEEATIVAAHRNLPENHLVYRILYPHWLKTFAINAGARSTLVPQIIVKIIGVNVEQAYSFIRYSYKNFNWTEQYVPTYLEKRGFPVKELSDLNNKKFHNYAYGRMVNIMWNILRNYVKDFLANGGNGFTTDEQVKNDQALQDWADEIRSEKGAQISTFPVLDTLEKLIDAVTMCIHIASPQHTAVNYLQQFYQSFVINKPPALCDTLPQTLEKLQNFTEDDFVQALPINRPQEWLLASHIPYLLSYRVAEEQNLLNYAISQYQFADQAGDEGIRDAAKKLAMDLRELSDREDGGRKAKGLFTHISDQLDDRFVEYKVMEPVSTAVSILI